MKSRNSLVRKILLFSFTCLFCFWIEGYSISPPRGTGDKPWLTGPLITPSARVVKKGHVNLEPYLYWTEVNGAYDKHWHAHSAPKFYQIQAQLVAKIGFAERLNLSIVPQSFRNHTRGVSDSGFGDLPIGLEIQLIKPEDSDFPLKLSIQELFPTGRFQRLKPFKHGTDLTGTGSYTTSVALTVSNLQHFCGVHFLQWRVNLGYGVPAPVHVRGLNAYGGDPTTRGKVFPGTFGFLNFGAEYTLTRNWALALDLTGQVYDKDRFKGHTIVHVGPPVFVQFTAAPAIEYNFNEDIGIIAGSIFTFAGKNAARFVNITAALNWYF